MGWTGSDSKMESRLKSILDRITSGALQPFGLDDSVDIESTGDLLRCKRQQHTTTTTASSPPLLAGDDDAITRDAKKVTVTWGEAWGGMCRTRDFSELGPGLARVASLHPFCASEECQRVVWGSAGLHGPLGKALGDFEDLDTSCVEAFLNWRLGWVPLTLQLPYLNDHPNVKIMDFSCFQMDPAFFVEALRQAISPFWGADDDDDDGDDDDDDDDPQAVHATRHSVLFSLRLSKTNTRQVVYK
mmetsp:Transcript_24103/g.32956  ORF Transcript_24103/g.32956 Transcript_24103/m.32956 type:complete len:244 (-) Transcript_24103:78-809(-)